MLSILTHGLQDPTPSHHVRVCAFLTAQFAFFSRADSGMNLLAEDVDIFDDTFSINVKAKNIERSQAAPLSRFTSLTHDPQRLFQRLQQKWRLLRRHNNNKRPYWLFHDEKPATAQIITTWLREIMDVIDLHTTPGVSYSGHSLRRGGASAAHATNVVPRVSYHGDCGATLTQPSATLTSTCNKTKLRASSSPTFLQQVECIFSYSQAFLRMPFSSGSLP